MTYKTDLDTGTTAAIPQEYSPGKTCKELYTMRLRHLIMLSAWVHLSVFRQGSCMSLKKWK